MRWLIPLLCCGCVSGFADWRIDVSQLAADDPGGLLVADLVLDAETQRRVVLRYDDRTEVLFPEELELGITWGMVAFSDLDGDGRCTFTGDPETDDQGWLIYFKPQTLDGFDWEPQLDPIDTRAACTWFGIEEITLEDLVRDPDTGEMVPAEG